MRILKRGISILIVLCMLLSLTACFDSKKSSSSAVGAGDGGGDFVSKKKKNEVVVEGELEIHFLELGNKYTGDCTYIKAGENDILIDAGSKTSSIETIDAFLKQNVADGKLEYVIVTHAHEDHYAGFATNENIDSLFDLYECEVIIDFAQITSGKSEQRMYNNYIRERDAEIAAGATHYTAAECINQNKNIFDLGGGNVSLKPSVACIPFCNATCIACYFRNGIGTVWPL